MSIERLRELEITIRNLQVLRDLLMQRVTKLERDNNALKSIIELMSKMYTEN